MSKSIAPKGEQRVEIEETADGSRTIYCPDLDEHYHSIYGARTESDHIYVQSALAAHRGEKINLLEIGLGSGLNLLRTWDYLDREKSERSIYYHSIELYPLDIEFVKRLYQGTVSEEEMKRLCQIHEAEWNRDIVLSPTLTLHKSHCNLLTMDIERAYYDVIYMDAFAPDKVPEQWNETTLGKLAQAMKSGGILSTYCAKGVVRRRLVAQGLKVYRKEGPVGGKREILVCHKP